MARLEYRITVEGELSDTLAEAFEGATMVPLEGDTMLIGSVRDQAELQGLLQTVTSFGLTLVAATLSDRERDED